MQLLHLGLDRRVGRRDLEHSAGAGHGPDASGRQESKPEFGACCLKPAGESKGQTAASRFEPHVARARAAPLLQSGFSSCLGGDGSLPLTDPIARSFLVASSPLLDPRSTVIGRLDGGFVPWQ